MAKVNQGRDVALVKELNEEEPFSGVLKSRSKFRVQKHKTIF